MYIYPAAMHGTDKKKQKTITSSTYIIILRRIKWILNVENLERRGASQVPLVVQNLAANAGDMRGGFDP